MTNLWVFRDKIRFWYSQYTNWIQRGAKFLSMLVVLLVINGQLGYLSILNHPLLLVGLSCLCAFLPAGTIPFVMYMVILGHFSQISTELVLVTGVIGITMFLMYFSFKPRNGYWMGLSAVAYLLGLPGPLGVAAGLTAGPIAVVPVAFGMITGGLVRYVHNNYVALTYKTSASSTVQKLIQPITALLQNKAIWLTILAVVLSLILVYLFRQIALAHGWGIGIISGTLVYILIQMTGAFMLDLDISFGGIFWNAFLAILLGFALRFFLHGVDYSRMEEVQFEDEDYVYYVKAVPKVKVTAPEVRVTKINARRAKVVNKGDEKDTST